MTELGVVRWGILGCGNVTEAKSGPALHKIPHSKLVAVMRRDAAKAQDYARRHHVPRWTTDAHDVIADPNVDIVYVATPVDSHEVLATEVLRAGKPVYVEKPMALHVPSAERMVAESQRQGVPLFVAYYRRALPRFLAVKQWLCDQRLGTVTTIRYRYSSPHQDRYVSQDLPWRLRAEKSGGGLFLDLGCHALDLLDFLFGPLCDVTGQASRACSSYEVEDTVVMTFRCGNALGTASWSFACSERVDCLEVVGTRGQLQFSVFGDGPLELRLAKGMESVAISNPEHIQQPLLTTIVDQLLGRGSCPSTGDSGLRTTVVMDAVLDSYYGGRGDAFWLRSSSWPGLEPNRRR